MCILFLAIEQHADFPLIVAANRDEFFVRPSAPMHFWQDCPDILAGRDMQAGGSWLGVNRRRQFCAVTNFRTGQVKSADTRSRGELAPMFLNGGEDRFDRFLSDHRRAYDPFNFIFGDPGEVRVYCSVDDSLTTLKPGCHAISNGRMNDQWPKMSSGTARLRALVNRGGALRMEDLMPIMLDQARAPDDLLPQTGIGTDSERMLSSIFIRGEHYGTRATTCLLFSENGLSAQETSYDQRGNVTEQRKFALPDGSQATA